MAHHGEALRVLGTDAATREALTRDPDRAPLPQRARALADYALKLTRAPGEVTATDVSALHAIGLSDAAIHDAAAVTAYFNFVNRIALGLGVALETDFGR
jgi:uncharacterized peroxidase-related enzyme